MKENIVKNKTLVIIVGLLLIAGIAFGAGLAVKNATATSDSYIGIEKARSIALTDAGLKASDVKFTSAHLDKGDRVPNYDFEFETASREYSYEIDATNGTILDKDFEKLHVSNSSTDKQKNDSASNAGNQDSNSNSSNSNVNNSNSNSSSSNNNQSVNSYIGVSKAKNIALNHAGVSAGAASFMSAHLDSDHGVKVYEIEFTANNKEYEYEINAITGAIIDYDIEVRDHHHDDDNDHDDDYDDDRDDD